MKICYLATKNLHKIIQFCDLNKIEYEIFSNDKKKIYIAIDVKTLDDKQLYQIKKIERKLGK